MLKSTTFLVFLLLSFSFIVNGQTKTAYLSAGDKAFAKEDYSSATNFYLNALEFEENDVYLMMQVGECNRRMFEYKTALAWLNRCMANDKEHRFPGALLYKAETLKCLSEFEEARSAIAFYRAIDSVQHRVMADSYLKNINTAEDIHKLAIDSVSLKPCGNNINSAYSDFSASYANDSTMLFSSLRFESEGSKNKNMISKILSAPIDSTFIGKAKPIADIINNPSWHNCNASISPDGNVMVFSRCNYNEAKQLICILYETKQLNGQWLEPVKLSGEINSTGYTSTQPCITTTGILGYTIFFASNKPGGCGLMDIYRTTRDGRGKYTKPENCGKRVNTTGNEFSPFFNSATSILYFSSDSLSGLGGLDIYKVKIDDDSAQTINIGKPFNSGYNDIYYSESDYQPSTGFLSSNRPGTYELYGQTCCYDVFSFYPAPKKMELAVEEAKKNTIANISPRESLVDPSLKLANDFLPLKLFFDNDYPDPGSVKPVTTKNYESLYQDYFAKLIEYIEGFKNNKTKTSEESAAAVEHFFASDLQFNHSQLEKFNLQVNDLLQKGNDVEITIRGCASPLADSGYNLILSKRRIASMINLWKIWNNGNLKTYLDSGKMKITEEAAGESLGNQLISDRVDDLANSVYNPIAARERKIEILRIKVRTP